jgi:hypothetical protein
MIIILKNAFLQLIGLKIKLQTYDKKVYRERINISLPQPSVFTLSRIIFQTNIRLNPWVECFFSLKFIKNVQNSFKSLYRNLNQ